MDTMDVAWVKQHDLQKTFYKSCSQSNSCASRTAYLSYLSINVWVHGIWFIHLTLHTHISNSSSARYHAHEQSMDIWKTSVEYYRTASTLRDSGTYPAKPLLRISITERFIEDLIENWTCIASLGSIRSCNCSLRPQWPRTCCFLVSDLKYKSPYHTNVYSTSRCCLILPFILQRVWAKPFLNPCHCPF